MVLEDPKFCSTILSLYSDDKGQLQSTCEFFCCFCYRKIAYLHQYKAIPWISWVFISLWIIKCCSTAAYLFLIYCRPDLYVYASQNFIDCYWVGRGVFPTVESENEGGEYCLHNHGKKKTEKGNCRCCACSFSPKCLGFNFVPLSCVSFCHGTKFKLCKLPLVAVLQCLHNTKCF